MIIYRIINNINNKVYIGQTINKLKKRITAHKIAKTLIGFAIRKYGLDNFTIEQIDAATSIEELNVKEEQYIKEYDCISPNGYNLTSGGKNRTPSEETRQKLSNWQKGNKNPMYGKKLSEARKLEISVYSTGRKHSEVTKDKIRKRHIGMVPSEETKKKLSLSKIGNSYSGKKIICNETGEIFKSASEASRIKNIGKSSILHQLRGNTIKPRHGLTFSWIK